MQFVLSLYSAMSAIRCAHHMVLHVDSHGQYWLSVRSLIEDQSTLLDADVELDTAGLVLDSDY